MTPTYELIIVGGGLSGLSVAHFIHKAKPGADLIILEKGPRPGGAIRSYQQEGFLAEWGPHGFLDNAEATREILQDTGLEQEAQKAPLARFVRYICLGGRLREIPQNPKKIIASSLLPFTAKLRVLADLWKEPQLEEISVRDWARHRFGSRVLPFVDAVLTGTYAGDFERLSIDAVMPGIRELEKQAGSVLRGLLKKRRGTKRSAARSAASGLPSMVSFSQGMGRLPEVLARDKRLFCNTPVQQILRGRKLWQVQTADGSLQAANLVLALPVNQTISLLATSGVFRELPPPMSQIPEARIVTAMLGFSDAAKIPFGFGYLAPESEGRFALGALFSTHMFPGRAPAGHVLVEALIGGRRHPERLGLDDEDLVRRAYEDLRELIELPQPPVFTKVLRTPHAIPQLELGFPRLLAWREELLARLPGLHICGFGWSGIGINDMTKAARAVAEGLIKGEGAAMERTAVKGVYF